MARSQFGGSSADWLVRPYKFGARKLLALDDEQTTLSFWSASTGGTQYTDLLDQNSLATDRIQTADHQVPPFSGPDAILAMWVDKGDGTPRELMQARDLAAAAAAVSSAAASATAAAASASLTPVVTGLVAGSSSSGTKTANAAILAAAFATNKSAIVPNGTYYTNQVALVGPVDIRGQGMTTTTLINDTGTVLAVSGTQVNVSDITIRSDGGNHTIRQVGAVDQGTWRRVRMTQNAPGYSFWDNSTVTAMLVGMQFLGCVFWHIQTATVPGQYLKQPGGTVNSNTWDHCWWEYSGNYGLWIESTDGNSQYDNIIRDPTWEVCTGGCVKLIGCRDYLIENSKLWDMLAGLGGITTLQRHGIHADTNSANALSMGTIRHHARLDSTCAAGIVDIKLPGPGSLGFGLGYGTILDHCQNISNSNPLLIDVNSNECLIINPSSAGATLVTLTNAGNAQIMDKAGISLPGGQTVTAGSTLKFLDPNTGALAITAQALAPGVVSISGGSAPTAAAGGNAGTSPPAPVVNAASRSLRGSVTFGTGTTPAAGAQLVVTFANALTVTPVVTLAARNSATAALGLYISAASSTGFTISTASAPTASQANTVYSIDYNVSV